MLTQKRLDKEFPKAGKCVDDLLEFYRKEGYDRLRYVRACVSATMDAPEGDLMTALCSAVMFERLLEQSSKTKEP